MIQLTAQMHYGLEEMGCGGSPICGGLNHTGELRISNDWQIYGRSMVKTLQAADLKTGSAIVGDTLDPGSEFAISDRYLTKFGNKRGPRMRFDVVSPSPFPASAPALLAMRT